MAHNDILVSGKAYSVVERWSGFTQRVVLFLNKKLILRTMTEGTIARLTDRGFGFISRDGEEDLFFHSNELVGVEYNDLKEGDKVTFEVGSGPKGPNATKVSRV